MSNYIDEHAVGNYRGFSSAVEELASLINKDAPESDLQSHLQNHRYILSVQFPHCHHVIPRVRLGSQFEADFLCLDIPSSGYEWYGIELESPKKKVITKSGRKTADLEHALQQIRDWRFWIRSNINYARNELGLKNIDDNLRGVVIVGRRESFNDKFNFLRRQVLYDELIEVRSWDGIIEWARKRAEFFSFHG